MTELWFLHIIFSWMPLSRILNGKQSGKETKQKKKVASSDSSLPHSFAYFLFMGSWISWFTVARQKSMIKSFCCGLFVPGAAAKGIHWRPENTSGKSKWNCATTSKQQKEKCRAKFVFLCPCYALHNPDHFFLFFLNRLYFNVDLAAKESRLLANNNRTKI